MTDLTTIALTALGSLGWIGYFATRITLRRAFNQIDELVVLLDRYNKHFEKRRHENN